ncbi:MAG TPA: cyanophycin synthetase [Acetivibrio sp.]|uniref:cyanophycin synthetase n=1 Tax=Acetivibrio sp. TaxID=1872092 RepID=UPI002BEA9F56|nr:cyanophycin synthetase [Acetivibrio sp.]HOM01278.1 cyanophycin synthetase [Acetivibrio sp.]
MQIQSIQCFAGRNIYSHKPVVKITLDVGQLYKSPTKDLGNFNQRLLAMFPGLKKHYCSLGYEGGFAERLNEGTYIGHVTEHLIIEIQNILGYEVNYGKTRVVEEPSLYNIVFEYKNEKCAVECARSAVNIILKLVQNEEVDIEAILNNLRAIAVETDMGPSTKAIYEEAKKRGIPVTRIGDGSILRLGYGKYSRIIQASLTDFPSCVSVDMAGNKQLTKRLLTESKIPVPDGDTAYSFEGALQIAQEIGFPVVIKPLDSNQGKGVTLNVKNEREMEIAYNEAKKYSRVILVERYVKGKDYRVLVIGNRVAAVSERRPPFIVGDGIHTVEELIEIENSNNLRGDDHEKPLTKIKLDATALKVLKDQGVDKGHIPPLGKRIYLRYNGNLSTGGTARECTDEIHPYNADMAVRAAQIIGLDIAGVDITAEDISVPITHNNGAVIEINAAPGLRMHLFPSEGKAKNVAGDILDMMFPEAAPHSIPIVSVTGTNGKTTTTRLIRHTLACLGKKVGMTSTAGVYIGDECVLKGDNAGPASAAMVLASKEVEAAVLETARGGIVRKGLGYDLADVGVITNIAEDHLGMDGMNTLEDLAFAKSLVIEAVKPDGYSVLNADDKFVGYFMERAKGEIILFSKKSDNPIVGEHMKKGKKALYVDEDTIIIYNGKSSEALMNVSEIPITYGGIVECNIENSLAAASALYGLNLSVEAIRKGLATFRPDIKSNPGRFNIVDMGDFKVMLDYSHNPAGYSEVMKFLDRIEAKRLVGIIGMPGDRDDSSIYKAGEICSKYFSKIYIKEDDDLRGREPGEVAGIFYDAVISSGTGKENVEIVYSEDRALEKALLDAQSGDFIVMFYEDFERAVEVVERIRRELAENTMATGPVIQSVG